MERIQRLSGQQERERGSDGDRALGLRRRQCTHNNEQANQSACSFAGSSILL